MSGRRWTEQELAVVREQFPALGATRVAKLLGRSVNNVGSKARGMGLKLSPEAGYRSPLFKGEGEITGQFMSHVRVGARRRGYTFELTVAFVHEMWVKQDKCCFYSGRQISFANSTASIDRLDSTLPYTMDNVVLVHKLVNKMKLGRTHEQFVDLMRRIAVFQSP